MTMGLENSNAGMEAARTSPGAFPGDIDRPRVQVVCDSRSPSAVDHRDMSNFAEAK